MNTISLCMIVKNEEKVLARCLDSVKAAVDEIIIVDTGSVDRTKEIAQQYTGKVYDFKWINDFSAARNEAFSKATMDFQMWMDADDVLPAQELGKLIALKKTLDPSVSMVTMIYHIHFDEGGNPVVSTTRERLMRRDMGYRWRDPVHEYIPLTGNILYSDIVLHHRKNEKDGHADRNLKIYREMEAAGKRFDPRQQYYFARELKDHGLFAESASYFEKFLHSGLGWVEDNIAACHALSVCYSALGQRDKVLPVLTRSFQYDTPRAEICCQIGYHYKNRNDYVMAIECCACYALLGDIKSAKMYSEKAAAYRPDSKAVEAAKEILENM